MDKIAELREILALDPDNSFARYGLAMELASRGDAAAAIAEFDTLLEKHPGYTPAYFMSAQTLTEAGKMQEAIVRLKAGIVHARQDGNDHAAGKMQTLLDELDR